MKYNYINCPSYDPLFFALHLKDKGENIYILTTNSDIKKYCDFAHILCKEITQPILSLKTINSLKKFKKDAEAFFNSLGVSKEDKFYFFGNEISIEGFYFAKLFSEKCEVLNPYIASFDNYSKSLKNINGFKHLIGRKIFKKYLSIDLIFKDWKGGICYGIDQKFINKYHIMNFDIRKDFQIIKAEVIKNNQIELKKYDNLFDGGMFLNEGTITYESLKELAEFLLSLNVDFVVKNHPFFTEHLDYFKDCEKYPPYLPIEFTFGNIKKNFVSIYGQASKTASQIPNLKSISLLELVSWIDDDFKQKVKEILLNETPEIIFPNSYEELRVLLKD